MQRVVEFAGSSSLSTKQEGVPSDSTLIKLFSLYMLVMW